MQLTYEYIYVHNQQISIVHEHRDSYTFRMSFIAILRGRQHILQDSASTRLFQIVNGTIQCHYNITVSVKVTINHDKAVIT